MIHRLSCKPSQAGKHGPVRIYTNYNRNPNHYLQNQGRITSTRETRERGQLTVRTAARPVHVHPLSPQEIQFRRNESRGVQAAAFAQQGMRHEAPALTMFQRYNNTLKHFLDHGHAWPTDNCIPVLMANASNLKTFNRVAAYLLDTPILSSRRNIEYG